ncbi:MAG: S8 family serine peptidase [Candidatus Marinimicrobia bacterium]|nr:S8 family serine peptidase [Candidatus Neomarinimicrobiota bacterium]
MNSKRTSVHNKSLLYFCIAMILFLVSNESVQAQSFSLGVREYIQVDGQWYINEDGIIGDQVIPERIVIQLQPEMDIIQFDSSSLNLLGLQVITGLIAENFHVLKVPSNLDPFISATALSNLTEVINIEFDALGEWTESPDDPYWSDQWNLNVSKLNMPAAWDISTGSSSVILAIIDTGVEYEHEDLNGNIWVNPFEDFNGNGRADFYPYYVGGDLDWSDNDNNGKVDDLVGWDFQDNDNDPSDTYYHGTMVAGVALAQTNNYENGTYLGVAGAAGGWAASQGVLFMSLRVENGQPLLSQATEAITYAAGNGARVINMSFGFGVPLLLWKQR